MFKDKKVIITGGSRGIGKAIALRLAAEGARIAIAAKTTDPHPTLEGTIYSAADELLRAGAAQVLPIPLDVRDEVAVERAVATAGSTLGGIDILVNNASAISLAGTSELEVKRYDLMQDINVRGSFLMSKACIPALRSSSNPHILSLSPPLNMDPAWFGRHLAYTLSKYGMSMIVKGLAEELRSFGIAVNALWPKTLIATAAVNNLPGGPQLMKMSRQPAIVADAAAVILGRAAKECSGNFFIDEDVLVGEGIAVDKYATSPGNPLYPDLFL